MKSQINVQKPAPVVGERSIPPRREIWDGVDHGWESPHKSGDCDKGGIPKVMRKVFPKTGDCE